MQNLGKYFGKIIITSLIIFYNDFDLQTGANGTRDVEFLIIWTEPRGSLFIAIQSL